MKRIHSLSTSNSKDYRKALSKLVLFLIIFMIINYSIGILLENTVGTSDLHAQIKWKEFYELPSNSLDLIFIGSSYSYRTFDPQVFDEKLGINSFNMGSPLQKPVENYYVLKETLKYQNPNLVILDINWGLFNDDKYFNTKLWNFDNMKFSINKIEYLLNVFDRDQYIYVAPKSVRYHDKIGKLAKRIINRNNNIQDIDSYLKSYKGKGFIIDNNIVDVKNVEKSFEGASNNPLNYVWNEEQLKYLDKIVHLCKEKKVKLMFVTAPQSPIYLSLYDAHWYDYDNIRQTANNLAEKYEVEYLDYNTINKEKKLVTNEDFSDSSHLNYEGAQKISSHLADYLLVNMDEYFK